MPKRSREDTASTINMILQAVEKQLFKMGYDNMTYTTLSRQTGISRTGISHHFAKKTDFLVAMEERIYQKLTRYLVLNKQLTDFIQSWNDALSKPRFRSILRVITYDVMRNNSSNGIKLNTLKKLAMRLQDDFGDKAVNELEALLGEYIIYLSRNG